MMRLLARAGAGKTSALGFSKLSRAPIFQTGPGTAAAMASKPSSSSSSPSSPSPTSTPAALGSVSSRLFPNGLAVIELNRPGKLNALDADCCDAVSAALLAFERLAAEGGRGGGGGGKEEERTGGGGGSGSEQRVLPRALLLTGSREGSRIAFCAGGDVRAIREAALARPVVAAVSPEEEEERQRSDDAESSPPRPRRRPSSSFPLPPGAHPCERVFQAEYSMLSLFSASSLPALTFVDGVQMGLGAGLSSAALCSGGGSSSSPSADTRGGSSKGKGRKGGRGVSVVTERTLWAMPEGKIGLFPDVGFLAAAPGLAPGVAANAREAAAEAAAGAATRDEKEKEEENSKNLLFSAEAALLFGLTGARIDGGDALVAAGLASFCVDSSSAAEALLSELSRADFSGDASAALFAVAASASAAASAAASSPSSSSSSSSSSSLLLLEAAAEGGSLRPSLRRALDYREGGKKEGGDGKRLSRALLALRAEWEALAEEGGCAAARSALEAWIGKGGGGPPASCPLSSALTLRLAAAAAAEEAESGSGSSSSLWSSDPAAALRRQLSREFYPAARLAVSEAFAEGVRATLVEKGKGELRWPSYCSSLEQVEDSDVEALLLAESGGGLDVEGYLSRGCVLD